MQYSIPKKAFILFLLLFSTVIYAQNSFQNLKNNLEDKIAHSQFKQALAIINQQNRAALSQSQNADLDVMKVKLLVEFGLYDEALKLSQILVANPKLTPEQSVKTFVERELIFEINGNVKASKQAIDKAEILLEKHPELKPKNYTNFLIRKSSYYRVNGFKETAFKIAKEAKKYAVAVNDQPNLPVVEFILGFGYTKTNPKKALQQFKRSLQLYKELQHHEAINSMYNIVSNYLIKQKDYKAANTYIDSAIANVKNSNIYSYKGDFYLTKSEILEFQNKPDSALYFYKIATSFFNKDYNEQKDLKVQELNTQYELDKITFEKQQLDENIKKTKNLNITLVILLLLLALLLIGLAFFAWKLSKTKKKVENQREKIAEKNEILNVTLNEKQFLVKELNHRVKNNLSLILSLISFQKDEAENDIYKNKFDVLHQRIKTIAIAHNLYTYNVNYNDDSLIRLPDYTNKIFETLQYGSGENYTYHINVSDIAMKVDKALPLGLILNELITNSLKHAKPINNALVLTLKVYETENQQIKVEYTDNGTIFTFDKSTESLGIFIIEGMVKQLQGNYQRNNSDYKILLPNA